MIQPLQNRIAAPPAAGTSRQVANANSFAALFAAGGATTAAAAAPAATTAAAAAPTPTVQAQAPPASTDLFSPSGFESHMNQWLMATVARQNELATTAYNGALMSWNEAKAEGLEDGPPPQPPKLEPVEPMPPGWWFELHS